MEESERYRKGWNRLREMNNNSPIGARLCEIAPDLNTYIKEFAFGDVHSRPGLGKRERELVILSSLASLGYAKEEILEVFIQLAVYAGFPAAVNAVFLAKEVFDRRTDTPV